MELKDCTFGEHFQFPPSVEADALGVKFLFKAAVTSYDSVNKEIDEMVIREIVQAAKDNGVTDLTILNRKFILEAEGKVGQDKRERECCFSEALQMDSSPEAHGKWVKWYGDNQHHCTVCECYANAKIGALGYVEEEFLSEYCPNCGAKMDGGITP